MSRKQGRYPQAGVVLWRGCDLSQGFPTRASSRFDQGHSGNGAGGDSLAARRSRARRSDSHRASRRVRQPRVGLCLARQRLRRALHLCAPRGRLCGPVCSARRDRTADRRGDRYRRLGFAQGACARAFLESGARRVVDLAHHLSRERVGGGCVAAAVCAAAQPRCSGASLLRPGLEAVRAACRRAQCGQSQEIFLRRAPRGGVVVDRNAV